MVSCGPNSATISTRSTVPPRSASCPRKPRSTRPEAQSSASRRYWEPLAHETASAASAGAEQTYRRLAHHLRGHDHAAAVSVRDHSVDQDRGEEPPAGRGGAGGSRAGGSGYFHGAASRSAGHARHGSRGG